MAETRETKHLHRLKAIYAAGRFAPNTLDEQGMCHIHHAVYRGYLMCAKWLFKHGSSLTVRSAEGSVPAHYAAAGGHLECLKWIYGKSSKSISCTDNSGATPLYFSAQEGHLHCLVWLAKHSGTVHCEMSVDGMTAAHAAALEGHLECLAFLLRSAGCSALVRDRAANTPLHYAAACGRRSCVEWLLGNINSVGSERNKLGSSPLHVAAQNGHLEVVKLLVRAGATIKLRDRLGRTPFNVAIESWNEACAHFLHQAETYNIEGVNGLISGNHSLLKRVRFERKAIERDSESAYAQQQPSYFAPYDRISERDHTIRKPYSLYRNNANSGVSLNHHSNFRVGSDVTDKSPYGSSQMDGRHTARSPQGFDPASEDLQIKNHATSSSLLPWSRVYRMTQSTESLPNPYQPKVYGSYSLSDTNDRGVVSPERHFAGSQHYLLTSYENPSSEKQTTSFLSKFVSRRKTKEFFPADVDPFDVIVNNNSQEGNVFKRLYKFSKRKVTRSSSFALESLTDDIEPRRRNSFVVSGNDDFLSGSINNPTKDPISHQEQGDKIAHERIKAECSSTEVQHARSDSSKKERKTSGGKKTRKRLTNETSTPRENSLIW